MWFSFFSERGHMQEFMSLFSYFSERYIDMYVLKKNHSHLSFRELNTVLSREMRCTKMSSWAQIKKSHHAMPVMSNCPWICQ